MTTFKSFKMYEKSYIKGKMMRLRKTSHSLQKNYKTPIIKEEIELLKKNAIPYLKYIEKNIKAIDYNELNYNELKYVSSALFEIEHFISFLTDTVNLENHTEKIIDYINFIDNDLQSLLKD